MKRFSLLVVCLVLHSCSLKHQLYMLSIKAPEGISIEQHRQVDYWANYYEENYPELDKQSRFDSVCYRVGQWLLAIHGTNQEKTLIDYIPPERCN